MTLRNAPLKTCLAASASLAALIAFAPGLASAQTVQTSQPAPAASGTTEGEPALVVVTGSRIATQNNRAISPVRSLDAEEIRATGQIDIDEVLKQQNQFLPSNGATTSPLLLESHGASTLDMRGLGQNRTLVLVNGQRATPNGFRNSADVNAIPSALIARVDTLTGGAAAVYGADAVAGVTNFILRDNYEGFEIAGSAGVSGAGDAEAYTLGVTYGVNLLDDRLNFVAHVSYADRGGILRDDRSWAVPEVLDSGALIPASNVPAFTAGGSFQRFSTPTGTAVVAAPIFAYDPSGNLQTTGVAAPLLDSFSRFEAFWNPNDRWNAAVFVNYEIASWATLYGRVTHSIVNNTSQQLPVRTTGNPAAQDVLIQRTNPFLTPAITAAINATGGFNVNAAGTAAGTDAVRLRVSKTLLEFGPLTDSTERETTQWVVGVRGDITPNIRYDFAYVNGTNLENVWRTGSGLRSRFLQAVNATTVGGNPACVDTSGGCVPFNLFGPRASNAAAQAWIQGDPNELFNKRTRRQDVISFTLSGDTTDLFELPAGPIGWAFGYEYRKERGNSAFGARAAVRDTLHFQGARGVIPLVSDFNLSEFYGELRIPVLADLPLVQSFDIEAAARRSDHSRSGEYDTWKLGLNWAVNDSFRIRGSKQTVVRGPNIGEFFGAAVEAPITGGARPIDYCSDPVRFNVPAAFCTAVGAPAPGFIPVTPPANPLIDGAVAVQGGGEAIKPESGETYTYGFVFTPTFVPGLSVVVDYYYIQIDDAIGTINPAQLMDSCYLVLQDPNSSLCQKITRDRTTGRVVRFDQRDTNLTLLRTAGWDFSVYYNTRLPAALPGDRINITYNAGVVDTFVRLLFPSDNLFDCAGKFGGGACSDAGTGIRAIPTYRHNLSVAWTAGDVVLRGTWRHTGQVDALITNVPQPQWRNVAPNQNFVQHIDAYDYFDVGGTWFVNDQLRIGFTVRNVFDTEPPILGSAQQDANTLPNQYDIVGRAFTINATFKFN